MDSTQTTYKQAMKATSLFGGVQFVNIIVQIIRSKAIAVFLGTAGMGIYGNLNSTIILVSGLTNFGLATSAVKDIAAANASREKDKISLVVTVFRRLVWFTGLLGMLITLLFSSFLSELIFGNKDYTIAFIWMSITLLFNQLTSGNLVVLQGMQRLQSLAKANLLGSLVGLCIVLPLYYFLGIDGIVPGIISASLLSMLFSWLFFRRVGVSPVPVSSQTVLREGKNMLHAGLLISLSGILTLLSSYIVRIYITQANGLETAGLFDAGFVITNIYFGLIFNAMSTDYYPRLSANNQDNALCNRLINEQSEIAVLLLTPVLIAFLVFINWIIVLLYSRQFVPISGMLYWIAIGLFFKVISWSISFVFLAKSAAKTFFHNELIVNSYILLFYLIGYKYGGLTGIGFSFFISYFLYSIQVFFVARKKYSFSFNPSLKKSLLVQFIFAGIAFAVIHIFSGVYSYILGSLLLILSAVYSLYELDKRINIKEIFKKMKEK